MATAAFHPSIHPLAEAAVAASRVISLASTAQRNDCLNAFANIITKRCESLVNANQKDLASADKLSAALRERLELDEKRIRTMAGGVFAIAAQSDPIGQINNLSPMPSGIQVGKMRVPLGVILAIYESRPNVTADIAALAVKSGNAVILRGGGEAQHSSNAIGECMTAALAAVGLPTATAQVISGRDIVGELLCSSGIDLVIPRGGRGLIERVISKAKMPILKHLDGNCHLYIDAAADLKMAVKLTNNAKTRRFGVCNALECLLTHEAVAAKVLPSIADVLSAAKVELRGCAQTQKILGARSMPVKDDEWQTEYLAPILRIKVVASADDAITHINTFGSGHTDAIVSKDAATQWRFLREVDSSSVIVNASTAFADGGEYGLGAEVGISTDKLHARGPVGAEGLTTQKFIVLGEGQTRDN